MKVWGPQNVDPEFIDLFWELLENAFRHECHV